MTSQITWYGPRVGKRVGEDTEDEFELCVRKKKVEDALVSVKCL